MTDDCSNWLTVLVRGDVTEWERKFCASLIAQQRRGHGFTEKQKATLTRIRDDFRAKAMADCVIESRHDAQ